MRLKLGWDFEKINMALYVDDVLLVTKNMDAIKEVKMHLSSNFYMKDIDASNEIRSRNRYQERLSS
jgi:hypothetical protein